MLHGLCFTACSNVLGDWVLCCKQLFLCCVNELHGSYVSYIICLLPVDYNQLLQLSACHASFESYIMLNLGVEEEKQQYWCPHMFMNESLLPLLSQPHKALVLQL